jgi:hypothetical protein
MRNRIVGLLSAAAVTFAAVSAGAATIVEFSGNSTGALATGTASITLNGTTSITGAITNTAPFDARITAFGFDIGPGNLNGFSGTPNPITDLSGMNFGFVDDSLGNVPQFSSVELDFGYTVNSDFTGGNPNLGLDNFNTLNFTITGNFAGLTEAEIASALYTRFQRVGANGQGSDVATVTETVIPEPASMLLFGTGLAYLARRRLRGQHAS